MADKHKSKHIKLTTHPGGAKSVPIHWGALRYPGPQALWQTVDFMHTPPRAFAEHAASLAPETEVRVVQPGHSTAIGVAGRISLS